MSDLKRNFHMSMQRCGTKWTCDYCGASDDDVNVLRKTECSHVYEVCKVCGGCETSNECKPDCLGVLDVLADLGNDPSVYLTGSLGGAKG